LVISGEEASMAYGGAQTSSLWDDSGLGLGLPMGDYIAVSGNTGSGKSTLVRRIAEELKGPDALVISIDERSLHHPFVNLMFSAPGRYALGVQLNFLIQRHLMLQRWLEAGYTVVMERSHLDDHLFIDHHLAQGHVSEAEHANYYAIASSLHARTPMPDLLVCLAADAELSMRRLSASEAAGERPREFPDDEVKWAFVSSWAARYREFHREVGARYRLDETSAGRACMNLDATLPVGRLVAEVLQALKARRGEA
jgi:deoxyadenosine/deoxycytidine kinase